MKGITRTPGQTTPRNPQRGNIAGYFSLELIPDPCVIVKSDGSIVDINSRCADLIGDSKESLTGRYYGELHLLNTLSDKVSEAFNTFIEDFYQITSGNKHFEVFILPFKAEGDSKLVRIIFKDVSRFASIEGQLVKRNKELMIINSLSGAFLSSQNMDLAIETLFNKVLLITDFTTGWLYLKEDDSFKLKTSTGISAGFKKDIEAGALDSLCSDVIKMNDPLFILESAELSKMTVLHKEGIACLTAIPLIYERDAIGLLFIAGRNGREKHLDFDFAALLTLVGNHVTLIIDKIRLFQETRRLAITDGLTGLYNSRYFYKQLDAEIARSNRYGSSFSVILFDIDNFKQLNDSFGHQAGDNVLHELAKILQSLSRETDIVVRYGGEEFIIILPNTSEEDTINLAERIRSTVEKHIFLPGREGGANITISGGIASYPRNAGSSESLLNAADVALYSAKGAGKNRVLCFKGKISEKNIR